MIFVDTSVWVDFFNGQDSHKISYLIEAIQTERVAIGDLIYTEVLQGFWSDREFKICRSLLDSLVMFEMVGKNIALKSAENYRRLKKSGVTIRKTIDVLIATFCIENGHDLLHSDRDFDLIARHLALSII